MADERSHDMSELFRWYLGGLLATAREFSLLFAPNVNSYKRFQPGSWAPTGDRLGRRQPHPRVPRRRPRPGDAGREPDPGRRRQQLPRLRGDDRRRPARHRAAHRAAAAVPRQRLHGPRPAAHPDHVRRGDRAVARQRGRPRAASATTSTTTSCATPSSSGRRSTAPSPTGSAPATSNASDDHPAGARPRASSRFVGDVTRCRAMRRATCASKGRSPRSHGSRPKRATARRRPGSGWGSRAPTRRRRASSDPTSMRRSTRSGTAIASPTTSGHSPSSTPTARSAATGSRAAEGSGTTR